MESLALNAFGEGAGKRDLGWLGIGVSVRVLDACEDAGERELELLGPGLSLPLPGVGSAGGTYGFDFDQF